MPKVSIVMPAYNCAEHIKESIDSALAQTHKDIELIVVDDGSTDGTAEVVQSYENPVVYLYQENRGMSAARNTAMKSATGDFIAFLDSDDLWEPSKLEKQIALFETHPKIGMVGSYLEPIDSNGKRSGKTKPTSRPAEDFDSMFMQGTPVPTSVMIRSECVREVGYFNEAIFGMEEVEFFMRIAQKYQVKFMDEILGFYRIWEGNVTKRKKHKMWLGHIHVGVWALSQGLKPETRKKVKKRIAKYYYKLGKEYYLMHSYRKSLAHGWKALGFSLQVGSYFFDEADSLFSKTSKYLKPYMLVLMSLLKLPISKEVEVL